MRKYRQYVLPVALVVGLLLHKVCAAMSFLVPYLIFTILLLTFTAVELRRLRPRRMDFILLAYQISMAAGCYLLITHCGGNKTVAEGVMMASLCPVAASSTVVACMLGADRRTMTGYSIFGNLGIALVTPLFFTLIGDHPEHSLGASYLLMLGKISSTLALPFLIALALQLFLPKVNDAIAKRTGWSFYVWAVALLLTIGQTIHFIFEHGEGNWDTIAWLGGLSLVLCIGQFFVGRRVHPWLADKISGAQLMGQKNSAMGIWMCGMFLQPLSSVMLAFYSVFQNLFNAWQIARHNKTNQTQQ